MTVPEIRPTFELDSDLSVADTMDRLRRAMSGPEARATGCAATHHAELYVPEAARRLWSPWLSLELEERSPGCRVRGRFSPHPHVWTLYMFLWFALGFSVLVGASWGYAQWATDSRPWALLILPAAAVGAVALVVTSLVGQRLGRQQMVALRGVVFDVVPTSAQTITTRDAR